MATGWDEGGVYYADVGLRPGSSEGDAPGLLSKTSAKRRFEAFMRTFRSAPTPSSSLGELIYRDALAESPPPADISVELDDLIAHDPELAARLRESPSEMLPLLEDAASSVASSERVTPSSELNDSELDPSSQYTTNPSAGPVQVILTNSAEQPWSIRALSSADVSSLVKVSGIVTAASRTRSKARSLTLMCKSCRNVKAMPCGLGLTSVTLPRQCDLLPANSGQPNCGLDPFMVQPERSTFSDQQTLKLQELPEDVPAGEMPRTMLLVVDRNLVQKCKPGTRVQAVGVYTTHSGPAKEKTGTSSETVAVQKPYLRIVSIVDEESASEQAATFSNEEVASFKRFVNRPFRELREAIREELASSIFGCETIKDAVSCLLFGGCRKQLPDGVKLRGDINVLLLGDPSTAKSQFLKLAQLTAPISVYTSGKGSSAAGLTASVVKDSSTGEFYLEGGAMVQGDGGVVCIDEFDKMREEDRVAIHEAMEQQTISIAKAGINTVLNSRTSVLAAANPPAGRYDDLKSTADNIDLQTTILSRFDLIFIVRDERNFERDMSIARHVVDVHRTSAASNARQRQSGQQQQQQKSAQSNQQQACDGSSIDLKRFVQYAKKHYKPRLTAQAAQHLQQEYVKIRRDMRKRSQSEQHEREDIQRTMPGRQQQQQQQPGDTVIPITVRQLEAIVRISEAFARLSLQSEATQEHVDAALQLFRVSTMDAASSGVVEAPLSDEQKQELQSVESRIRQRVPIGGSIGSKQLKEDLLRLGVNEWAIERATRTMMESKVLEVVGERQRIKRIGA